VFHNGYWAGDVFYYQVRPGDRYYRDDYRHFRRDEFRGGIRFRYQDQRNHDRRRR
jgi:hypothetical protein